MCSWWKSSKRSTATNYFERRQIMSYQILFICCFKWSSIQNEIPGNTILILKVAASRKQWSQQSYEDLGRQGNEIWALALFMMCLFYATHIYLFFKNLLRISWNKETFLITWSAQLLLLASIFLIQNQQLLLKKISHRSDINITKPRHG